MNLKRGKSVRDYYNMAIKVADGVLQNPMQSAGEVLRQKLG